MFAGNDEAAVFLFAFKVFTTADLNVVTVDQGGNLPSAAQYRYILFSGAPQGFYQVSRVACCPCLAISATAFLSNDTNVSPPSQFPS